MNGPEVLGLAAALFIAAGLGAGLAYRCMRQEINDLYQIIDDQADAIDYLVNGEEAKVDDGSNSALPNG